MPGELVLVLGWRSVLVIVRSLVLRRVGRWRRLRSLREGIIMSEIPEQVLGLLGSHQSFVSGGAAPAHVGPLHEMSSGVVVLVVLGPRNEVAVGDLEGVRSRS